MQCHERFRDSNNLRHHCLLTDDSTRIQRGKIEVVKPKKRKILMRQFSCRRIVIPDFKLFIKHLKKTLFLAE